MLQSKKHEITLKNFSIEKLKKKPYPLSSAEAAMIDFSYRMTPKKMSQVVKQTIKYNPTNKQQAMEDYYNSELKKVQEAIRKTETFQEEQKQLEEKKKQLEAIQKLQPNLSKIRRYRAPDITPIFPPRKKTDPKQVFTMPTFTNNTPFITVVEQKRLPLQPRPINLGNTIYGNLKSPPITQAEFFSNKQKYLNIGKPVRVLGYGKNQTNIRVVRPIGNGKYSLHNNTN